MSLTSAAASGDNLATLKQLRDDLALRMENATSDQNYSVMARVFTDVLDKIAVLDAQAKGVKGTVMDELAKRRTASGRPDSSGKTGSTRQAK